ncbi:MAG: DUF2934 domain-containing protein [Acidiferrobacterales bacterium]
MAKQRVESSTQPSPAARASRIISAEERHQLIAETAYYRAERRGFAAGDPVADWLAAEAEVEGRLNRVH